MITKRDKEILCWVEKYKSITIKWFLLLYCKTFCKYGQALTKNKKYPRDLPGVVLFYFCSLVVCLTVLWPK
ncbi:MAG: hypothetical protein ACFWT2_15505 [Thermoanaerobacterium thermosaccharolyticum]|jgi:hypothetical protein